MLDMLIETDYDTTIEHRILLLYDTCIFSTDDRVFEYNRGKSGCVGTSNSGCHMVENVIQRNRSRAGKRNKDVDQTY